MSAARPDDSLRSNSPAEGASALRATPGEIPERPRRLARRVCFAAGRSGVRARGITASRQQLEVARCRPGGFAVETELLGSRDLGADTDDAVVSTGMFEHVGPRSCATFLDVVRRCLAPDELPRLHPIGRNESTTAGPWIGRNVFPKSVVPSPAQIASAAEERFAIEDAHSFGTDDDRTLLAWNENVEKLRSGLARLYDDRFFRMWRYALLSCAGAFRARQNDLWQLALSPHGQRGDDEAPL